MTIMISLSLKPILDPPPPQSSRSMEYSLDQSTSTRRRRWSVQTWCRARAGIRRRRPSPGSSSSRGVCRTSSRGSWHCCNSVTSYWGRLRKISLSLPHSHQREQNLKNRNNVFVFWDGIAFLDMYLHIYTTSKWTFLKSKINEIGETHN